MPVCTNRYFSHALPTPQDGMTLIEVLVAVLILAIGLLGAAAIQLNALRFIESSRMATQASFIAYDMLDRIRANASADYSRGRAERSTSSAVGASVRDQDLHDFEANILAFAGESAKGSVAISANEATVTISWDDNRASTPFERETFTLSSRIGDAAGSAQ